MLNARNGFPIRLLAVAALVAVPAFHGVSAADDDSDKKAPVLDLNALMQQKLNAKMSGQLEKKEDGPADGLDSTLSDRVSEQKAETTEQLEAQSSTLTSANRAEHKEEGEEKPKGDEEAVAKAPTR